MAQNTGIPVASEAEWASIKSGQNNSSMSIPVASKDEWDKIKKEKSVPRALDLGGKQLKAPDFSEVMDQLAAGVTISQLEAGKLLEKAINGAYKSMGYIPAIKPGKDLLERSGISEKLGLGQKSEIFSEIEESLPTPETKEGKIARAVGEFAPFGPGGITGEVSSAIAPALNSLSRAAAGAAQKTGKTAQKGIEKLGKTLASVETMQYSQPVKDLVKSDPLVLLEPKKTWQNIYNEAFDFLEAKRSEVGKQIGDLNSKIRSSVKGETIRTQDVINKLDEIGSKLTKGTSRRKFIDEAKMAVRTGGESIDYAGKSSLTKSEAKKLSKMTKNNLDIDDLSMIIENIESFPEVQKLNAAASQGKNWADKDAIVTRVLKTIKGEYDGIANRIDDQALKDGIIEAKGEYAKLASKARLLGSSKGISREQLPRKIDSALMKNYENDYDALKELFPEKMFKEMVAGSINSKADRLALSRPVPMVGTIASEKIGQTGSIIAGGEPAFELTKLGDIGIRGRNRLGKIAESVSRTVYNTGASGFKSPASARSTSVGISRYLRDEKEQK